MSCKLDKEKTLGRAKGFSSLQSLSEAQSKDGDVEVPERALQADGKEVKSHCNLPQTVRSEKSRKFSLSSETKTQRSPVNRSITKTTKIPDVGQVETKHEAQKLLGRCWSQNS